MNASLSFGVILDTIKQRLRASLLVPDSGKNALDVAARLASELRKDGSWPDLGEPTLATTDPRKQGHLARTLLLAKACHLAPGELRGATQRAFDWWLAHDFQPADWHQTQVMIPRLVGEIALLSEDAPTIGTWGKIIEILTRSRWAHWVVGPGWVEWTGSPVVEVAYNIILRGCLENSPTLCEGAFQRAFRKVKWPSDAQASAHSAEDSADSLQPCIHDAGLIRNYARLMTLAHGTHWQAPVESTKAFVSYLLDFQQWMLWRDVPEQDSNLSQTPAGVGTAIAQLAQLGNPPRRAELADMADRLGGRGKALVGHRHFWRSRFAVHQRPTFYCSLALGQPSTQNVAANGNHRNVFEQNLYFLRTGGEYVALTEERNLVPAAGTPTHRQDLPNNLSSDTFETGGGLSEGEYGMAASTLNGGGRRGKRAWFFFDESVVCLGAALTGPLNHEPLYTRVNRCRLDGSVVVDGGVTGSRQVLANTQRHELKEIQRVEHGGFLYYFPRRMRIVADLEAATGLERSAARSEEVFTLRIQHESHAPTESPAWFVLPLDDDPASRSKVEIEINQIELIANNTAVQAVRHLGSGVISVAFWEPSVLALSRGGRIAANSPCMILCREGSDGYINVTIASLLPQASVVHVEYQGRCVCFELPGGADAGRSFRRRL